MIYALIIVALLAAPSNEFVLQSCEITGCMWHDLTDYKKVEE